MPTNKLQILTPIVTSVNGNTGDVTVATKTSELENDSGFATTTYVDTKVANLVDSAPETLDTLNELSAALGDDPNFATTMANQIGAKQDKITTSGILKSDGTGNITSASETEVELVDIAYPCNPNLLKNWCFLNGRVVNQRGETSYTGSGYTIDMWKSSSAALTAKLANDGFTVSASDSVSAVYMNQYLETKVNAGVLSTLVASVTGTAYLQAHYTDGTFSTAKKIVKGVNIWTLDTSKTIDRVLLQVNKSASVKIQAVKLELGTEQTLAHQDADGNWVLNAIPDYAEVLRKCQRYLVKLQSVLVPAVLVSTSSIGFFVPLPVTMRTKPVINTNNFGVCETNGGTQSSGFTFVVSAVRSNGVALTATKESHGISAASLSAGSDGSLLSAEL